jgi:hypothetical protein
MTDLPNLDPRQLQTQSHIKQDDEEEDSRTAGEVEVEVDDSAPLVEPHQDLDSFLETFWTRQMGVVERDNPDFKTYPLPLARIKKVMKSDEEVKVSHEPLAIRRCRWD